VPPVKSPVRSCYGENPDFATEVTLQPIDRYPLDAAILFSDILTVPDAMGLALYFETEKVRNLNVVWQPKPMCRTCEYRKRAACNMCMTRSHHSPRAEWSRTADWLLRQPWTLACYMVEGEGSREFHTVKKMMYSRPDLMHRILS
jgi:uroporphyrinogen decarboxylase